MKKLAVLFPGIGYHCDKPLLYYSKKCLSAYGYEIIEVNYRHFPHMKDKDELIKQAEDIGYAQTEEILKDIPFSTYDEILFVSKSIGTAISARFNEEHHVNAYSIYFTPLVATFKYSLNGIAFHVQMIHGPKRISFNVHVMKHIFHLFSIVMQITH